MASRDVPVVETERLVLRGHTADDFAESLAMWSDPRVGKQIGGRALSSEEVWSKVLRYVGHWELLGFGYWVVVERKSGRFVGEVGLADFKRDLEPPLGDKPEAGWVLAPWAHGCGYATEATRGALGWGDAFFGAGVTSACIIAPDNLASLRVASKCGFRETRRTLYKGGPVVVFERPAGG